MSFQIEKREALTLLEDIENGTERGGDTAHRLEECDPALAYFMITWLRTKYGNDHPAALGVLGRIVEITKKNSAVTTRMNEGKSDPIVTWFEGEHSYKDFDAEAFIDLVIEKLEG